MTTTELRRIAAKATHSGYDSILEAAATEIESLQKSNESLQKELRAWRNEKFEESVVAANNELRRQNAELRECLKVKDEALRMAKHRWALRFAKTIDEIKTIETPFDKALAAQPE